MKSNAYILDHYAEAESMPYDAKAGLEAIEDHHGVASCKI